MTFRIGIMGAACAGKSTITAEAFALLKKAGYNTAIALEFVRDGFANGLLVQSAADQLLVYNKQLEREERHSCIADVVISDSPLFLTYFYGLEAFKDTPTDRMALLDLYQKFLNNRHRYDLVVMLEREHEYVLDGGIRQQSQEEADKIHEDLKRLMDLHKIEYETFTSYNEALAFIIGRVDQEQPNALCDDY